MKKILILCLAVLFSEQKLIDGEYRDIYHTEMNCEVYIINSERFYVDVENCWEKIKKNHKEYQTWEDYKKLNHKLLDPHLTIDWMRNEYPRLQSESDYEVFELAKERYPDERFPPNPFKNINEVSGRIIDLPYMLGENWKKLKKGMSKEKVLKLFKFPAKEYIRDEAEVWKYSTGYLIFADDSWFSDELTLVKWESLSLSDKEITKRVDKYLKKN